MRYLLALLMVSCSPAPRCEPQVEKPMEVYNVSDATRVVPAYSVSTPTPTRVTSTPAPERSACELEVDNLRVAVDYFRDDLHECRDQMRSYRCDCYMGGD